jgi:hypothetical protein
MRLRSGVLARRVPPDRVLTGRVLAGRILAAGTAALAVAAVLAAPQGANAAAVPAAPFTAFTVDSQDDFVPAGQSAVFDNSNAFFTENSSTAGMVFNVDEGAAEEWGADMQPPTGGEFVVGQTYPATRFADATHAGLDMHHNSSGCSQSSGSLTIKELVHDPDTQLITAFAVSYTFDCQGNGSTISGDMRFNSSVDYQAAVSSPPGTLDFGAQDIGQNGTPQTVTFTSLGSLPLALGTASITGAAGDFSITGDTCSGQQVAYQQSCAVTVTPHATQTGQQTASLVIPDGSGSGQRSVPLRLVGLVGAAGTYYPLTPTRILDTRNGTGAPRAALGAGRVLHLQVDGQSGVPAGGVSSVVLNLTVTGPTANSFLTAFPAGAARPTASSINFPAGWTGANFVTVQVGTGGRVDIYNSAGSVQVIADVLGFYAGNDDVLNQRGLGGQFFPTEPERLLDTRQGFGTLRPGDGVVEWLDFGDLNPHIRALAVNITAVVPSSSGFLTAWDGNNFPPLASTLNFTRGTVVPNLAIVPTMPCNFKPACAGMASFEVVNGSRTAQTHVLIDLFGFYDDSNSGISGGLRFHPVTPTRIVDSRIGLGTGPLHPNSTGRVVTPGTVANQNSFALMLNVAAVGPTTKTFLTVWPDGFTRPAVSNLNPAAHQTVANGVITFLSDALAFDIYNSVGTTNVIADVAGTFDLGVDVSPAARQPAVRTGGQPAPSVAGIGHIHEAPSG